MTDKIVEIINKDFSYPDIDDTNLQQKLYEKREFHYYRLPENEDITDPEDIKRYRTQKCSGKLVLQEHQNLLSNFINPNTPYKGLLVFHGVGTGKCVHGSTYIYVNGNKTRISHAWNLYVGSVIPDDEGEWGVLKNSMKTYSYDSTRDHIVIENVVRLYRQRVSEHVRKIVLDNGVTVTTTYKHSFIVNGIWTNIINNGDYLVYYTGSSIGYRQVVNITEFKFTGYLYDLETEISHTYLANDIISHNTCAAISIAEKFKDQIQRYGTKIYVLLPGPLLKEQWKRELIKCTGNTYITDPNVPDIQIDKDKQRKEALNVALQYYKFVSYKGFYKRVLGEKIFIKKDGKKEFERDIPSNRIINLNNSLIIVEEAHNLTGNDYGTALQQIIDNSINLKVILLTATPMKNLGDDIVDLINFLRPKSSRIARNKVFSGERNHLMGFEKGGEEYLKNMCKGYVSYLKGGNPLTYAAKKDMGEIPEGLLFTKVIKCKMNEFQLNTYRASLHEEDDALDRKSEAIANFVFPGLDEAKNLVGYYGIEGRVKVINQLKIDSKTINHKICDMLKIKRNEDMIYLSQDEKTVSGDFLKIEHVKNFSTKFHDCLIKINDLVAQKNGARTAFIYSNLVRIGIELFQEILLKNGYFEYNESRSYPLQNSARCYFCGLVYKDHVDGAVDKDSKIPPHKFSHATFVTVTGKSDDGSENVIPEEKQRILDDVFSNIENKNGKFIKFVIGSKVMNEGISLKNVAEVHVLDVYYNLGRIEQVVGRAIRHCSHYSLMMEGDMYPEVKVYKYCITLGGKELSSEETLYSKAEQKYLLIKRVERALKEVAIDCPLNISTNVSKALIKQHAKCSEPGKPGQLCPEVCDFTSCDYKCHDQILNNRYYDPDRKLYKKISKQNLDYSTFTGSLARSEIDNIKSIIKKLYKVKHIYNLVDIVNFVKKMYDKSKIDLYDDYFVFKALDELIPVTLNDINNFKDYIRDKYNINGYIVAVKDNYIFQPLDQPKDLSIYYRTVYNKKLTTTIPLSNYIKDKYKDDGTEQSEVKEESVAKDKNYDLDYYDSRPEYDVIGIIEKYKGKDNFKIRDKRDKNTEKKRATGIPSLTGAVCTTKDKDYIKNIANKLRITYDEDDKRIDICNKLRDKLLLLEKYSTGKDKKTYMMVPINHKIYQFPYNLEDRTEHVKHIIQKIDDQINVIVKKVDKNYDMYISKVNKDSINKLMDSLASYDVVKKSNEFVVHIR